MKSKNYLELLLNEYENRELTKEDLKSTLEHYAYLYNQEQKGEALNYNTKQLLNFKNLKVMDTVICRNNIKNKYNDWKILYT